MKKILQIYADYLIKNLEKSTTEKEFEFWFNQALNLDFFCTTRNIYLV